MSLELHGSILVLIERPIAIEIGQIVHTDSRDLGQRAGGQQCVSIEAQGRAQWLRSCRAKPYQVNEEGKELLTSLTSLTSACRSTPRADSFHGIKLVMDLIAIGLGAPVSDMRSRLSTCCYLLGGSSQRIVLFTRGDTSLAPPPTLHQVESPLVPRERRPELTE